MFNRVSTHHIHRLHFQHHLIYHHALLYSLPRRPSPFLARPPTNQDVIVYGWFLRLQPPCLHRRRRRPQQLGLVRRIRRKLPVWLHVRAADQRPAVLGYDVVCVQTAYGQQDGQDVLSGFRRFYRVEDEEDVVEQVSRCCWPAVGWFLTAVRDRMYVTGFATQPTNWNESDGGNATSGDDGKMYERLEPWWFEVTSIMG
jgi:hypothetical protein